jgi:hypothetical protein
MTNDVGSETPTPSDLIKKKLKDFYFAVGVAMVRWQDVEFELNELFCTLTGADHATASAVFNTVPSFPTKLKMVRAAALVRLGGTDLFKLCKDDLCKHLGDVEGKRNQIAHFMMFQDPPAATDLKEFAEKMDWHLAPTRFDALRRLKGEPPLKTSDIKSRTSEFGEAAKKIRDFNAQVKAMLKLA